MFTGNIYYRGDKKAAEDVLHESTQLANAAVAKKEYLGTPNFREQFVLSSGATLDVVINEHQQFITIVGFGAELEEPVELIEEEEEEKIALFVCEPVNYNYTGVRYPQVVIYATENKVTDETTISMEWGDGIKGGRTYSQFRGQDDPELISLEHTDKSQYLEGTNYSEGAGTKAYVGGYTLVDADLPLLGAAKVKTTTPADEVFEALCFVAYDDPNHAIKLYYHPLVTIDYTSEDFEVPLVDWADCTLFDTILFKQYDWKDPSNLRYNNDFTLATFDSDGTTCVFSALKGRWRYDVSYPLDQTYPTSEENRQDLWTLTLEASKDPGDGHIVLETATEEYELITLTSEWQEDQFADTPLTDNSGLNTSTDLSDCVRTASIGVQYADTISTPYIRNSSRVTYRNGVANKGPYFGRVVNKDGDVLTVDYWKENVNLFSAYPAINNYFTGYYVDAQGVNVGGGYYNSISIGNTIIAHISQNTYGGMRTVVQSCSFNGLAEYIHPLYTSGVPLQIPPGEDADYLEGGKAYTVTFPHLTDTTKDRRTEVTYSGTGYYVNASNTSAYDSAWSPTGPGISSCLYSVIVTGQTLLPPYDYSINPSSIAERKETKYTPLNFALREGVSISARYIRPSKPAPYVIYPYDFYDTFTGLTYTRYTIGLGYEEVGYGSDDDTIKDYSVRGSCWYTLESKYGEETTIVDLPGINQYHDDLPDTNQNAVADSRYWVGVGADVNGTTSYYADNTMTNVGSGESIFTHVWHESIEDCQWPNNIRNGIQDYRSYTPDPPQVAFCSHPRNYLMFSCGNKFAQSFFENEAGGIGMTWQIYDQKNNEFTDLLEMYNKLLSRTESLTRPPYYPVTFYDSFYRYSSPQPPWDNEYQHIQPDLMRVYGMVSKIPLPQLRTP
jgi:hypothetical protein